MRIQTLGIAALSVPALLSVGLLFNILELDRLDGRLQRARDNQLASFKLADRMRQSSDDLTRMVRTYVVTGERRYRDYFFRILAIRDGEAPRPPGYEGIYWDFILPGENEPTDAGRPLSLRAQMARAGFTGAEFSLLSEAQARSDELVKLEKRAMALVEAEGAGPAQREAARQLVHGAEYHRAKAYVMEPIARFIHQVEGRTRAQLAGLEGREWRLVALAWALLIADILSLLVAVWWVRRGVLVPIGRLTAQARRVAGGDYRARVASPGDSELGQLAAAFNTMTEAVHRDIDRHSERERELQRLRREAEQANRAKGRFLAAMSHELRTPMNAVLGCAQLLEVEEGLGEDSREQVGHILGAGRQLLDLINDLLDLSRMEEGELELESIEFSLAQLVEEVGRAVAPQVGAKGLSLAVEVAPAVCRSFVGDPARLRQVLFNLLGNAVKFTERGGVGVRAEAGAGGGVVLEVYDSGIGIEPQVVERLFEPFTQADDGTRRRFGGSGLGLALIRRLVDAMEGRVEVESEPGRGSRFRVSLPLAEAPHVEPPVEGA